MNENELFVFSLRLCWLYYYIMLMNFIYLIESCSGNSEFINNDAWKPAL